MSTAVFPEQLECVATTSKGEKSSSRANGVHTEPEIITAIGAGEIGAPQLAAASSSSSSKAPRARSLTAAPSKRQGSGFYASYRARNQNVNVVGRALREKAAPTLPQGQRPGGRAGHAGVADLHAPLDEGSGPTVLTTADAKLV